MEGLALLGLVAGMLVIQGGTASANPACSGTTNHAMGRSHPDSGDQRVAGMHAPLQLREDSYLCDASSQGIYTLSSQWLGLQDNYAGDQDYGQIRQLGYTHEPHPGPYCLFWAAGIGIPHEYNCSVTDNQYEFIQIVAVSQSGPNVISIQDCGHSNYDSCFEQGNGGTPNEYRASAVSEDSPDNTNCPPQIQTAGSSGNPVNYGTLDHAIHIKENIGDTWDLHQLGQDTGNQFCSGQYKYQWDSTNYKMTSWDSRN
jgi:hypothetical protein